MSAGEVPIKILKESTFCFPGLTNCINESLTNNKFPDTLKLSGITPFFKKLDPIDEANYRPVSIMPLSKVFEKIMYDQLYEYIEHFLNHLLCGFRKKLIRYNICFSDSYKIGKKELDSEGFIDKVLMDLSKAYDYLPHLLIAKLKAYDLDNGSLNLLLDYLSFR